MHHFIIIGIFLLAINHSYSQELLTPKLAIKNTLENNLGIKIAENNTTIAKNNAGLLNLGFLPTVSVKYNITFNDNDSETTLRDGSVVKLNNINTSSNNVAINADYVVFDGLGRLYNYKKFKTQHQLSEIDTKIAISDVIVQLTNLYYDVATVSQNLKNLKATLQISKDRWKHTKTQHEYGQKTGLDILNAEVDINTDSINVLNAQQNLRNAKRDLNLIMNESIHKNYTIDTTVTLFSMSQMLDIREKAIDHNFLIQKSKMNTNIGKLDHTVYKTYFLPKIILNGQYGIRNNKNSPVSFATQIASRGFSYGATLSWDLFKGGKAVNAIRNQKIAYDNTVLQEEQNINKVHRDIESQWETYLNNIYIYNVQQRNIQKSQDNFNRSKQKYDLGQITSIEFRQAQINLLNANNTYNNAKYTAKKSEIQFLYTAGKILDVEL